MRRFGLTCWIPDWCYGLYGGDPHRSSTEQLALTNDEMRSQHPELWAQLEEYLAPLRTEDYGYGGEEDWRRDVAVNPSADPDNSWFFVHPDGRAFWKWRHDPHSHGELWFFPGHGWSPEL